MAAPNMVRHGLLSCQVCVPKEFTDAQAEEYVNQANPTGISSQWRCVKQGSDMLLGSDERVQCTRHSENVHILMSC